MIIKDNIDYIKVYFKENWYTIKKESIMTHLGVNEINEDVIIEYMNKYY